MTLGALFTLIRPRFAPLVLLLPLFGWAWAHWDRALAMRGEVGLLWVLAAWFMLHCGTMWLNAALDRDAGEVLYGRAVPPPPYASAAGWTALLLAVPLGFMAGLGPGIAVTAGAALAALYSHPRIAWKGHAWGGPFVNVVGYGLLSPYAGWAVVGVPANPRTLVAWSLFAVGILAPYFAAQAFQGAEDAARGYRTAVVVWGPRRTLQFGRAAIGFCLWGGIVLAALGWVPRVCLVAIPLWWWVDRLLVAWSAQPDGGDARWAGRFGGRVLVSVVLVIAVCLADYVRASLAQEPVAGLGTVAGHPADRPRLPPSAMRRWEFEHGIIQPGGLRGRR